MKIGIIGAGNVGSALAEHFGKLQHTVLIANSRGPETLSKAAEETGATAVAISEVAKGVDLLIITIPMKAVPSLPKDSSSVWIHNALVPITTPPFPTYQLLDLSKIGRAHV